ncbi:MAG: hypothetical protein PHS14_14210, partial [Elusimicrobia bacterium]|nr:hypothetical protein [Elusimicrobiota bacterium]
MFDISLGVMALSLTLGGAHADMLAAPAASAPRLQLSRLSGSIEVELEKRIDAAPSRALPFLHSGSIVRVRSGSAAFDSDYHVTVRASEGDAFQFLAVQPEGSRSGSIRLSAVEREPKSLEVSVGDHKFRLRKGAAISITSAWPGEMTVRSEGRGVSLAPGSLDKDGSILSSPRA